MSPECKAVLFVRLLQAIHKINPAYTLYSSSQRQVTTLQWFLDMPMASTFCAAGYRYKFHHCLTCHAHSTSLEYVEHPFLSKCILCTPSEEEVLQHKHVYTINAKYNPLVAVFYQADPVLQKLIISKLLTLGTHPSILAGVKGDTNAL